MNSTTSASIVCAPSGIISGLNSTRSGRIETSVRCPLALTFTGVASISSPVSSRTSARPSSISSIRP